MYHLLPSCRTLLSSHQTPGPTAGKAKFMPGLELASGKLCLFLPTWERAGAPAGVPGIGVVQDETAGQQGRQGCSRAPEGPSPVEAEHS